MKKKSPVTDAHMRIQSAVFMRGLKGDNELLADGKPQVAFIGRSNVGKSSLLNTLTRNPKLARTSAMPGRTQEMNVFLVNGTHYFIDLPGYGYAKATGKAREKMGKLISWYFYDSSYNPTIVLLIDAEVGPTVADMELLHELERAGKQIVVVANKVDKIKKSQYRDRLKQLGTHIAGHTLFPFSSKTKVGVEELLNVLLV